jgi:hypothetical protein
MGERCPFCWGPNVTEVGTNSTRRASAGNDRLLYCGDCESWYWADRPEESTVLFEHCTTPRLRPRLCNKEIREICLSGGSTGFFRRRLAEFNHLCAGCATRHFERSPIPIFGGGPASSAPVNRRRLMGEGEKA